MVGKSKKIQCQSKSPLPTMTIRKEEGKVSVKQEDPTRCKRKNIKLSR